MFSVSLGTSLTPKRNWRQCLCKILGWQTKSIMVCYGIFWSGQLLESLHDISSETQKRVTRVECTQVFILLSTIFGKQNSACAQCPTMLWNLLTTPFEQMGPDTQLSLCFQCSSVGASFCYLLFYLVGRQLVQHYLPERVNQWQEQVLLILI